MTFKKICMPGSKQSIPANCTCLDNNFYSVADSNLIIQIQPTELFNRMENEILLDFSDNLVQGISLKRLDKQFFQLSTDYISWALSKDGDKAI